MLWKWITSGSEWQQRTAQRYFVVIIDELAKVPGGRGDTELFLFYPRPSFWKTEADGGMAHLKPLFCTLASGSVSYEHAVVVSDPAMDLPGVMCGLACLLRAHKLNLRWLATKPGAGAKELAAVWGKAPAVLSG